MPTDRTSIIAGPGRITYNNHQVFFKDDLKAAAKLSTFDVVTSGRRAQKREEDFMYEITGTPNGVFSPVAALINDLAAMHVGQDIFGAGTPLVIDSADGQTYTYKDAAPTKLPDLMLSAGKTLWGGFTFTCLGANNTAPTAADRRLVIADSTYPVPDGYNPDDIITQAYLLNWGSSPWASLETEAGATVSFALQTSAKKSDSGGTIGMRFKDLPVTAKAKPLGVTSADVLTAMKVQGAGAGRGGSMVARGRTLAITGTGIYVALNAAAITDAGDTFSADNNRVDELTWAGNESFSGGVLHPNFFLGTAAPV